MNFKKNSLFLATILMTSSISTTALAAEETCFETNDGMEVCIKQKVTKEGNFTQQDANNFAQALPKLNDKQLSALNVLLQSQNNGKISTKDVQNLVDALPKLPDNVLNALTTYVQGSETGNLKPEEIKSVITNLLEVPAEYQDSVQSALKLISNKAPSEADVIDVFSQILKASDAPDEIGDTVQSYFNMMNQDDKASEEQFLKAGTGLLNLIIKASKEDSLDSNQ